MDEKKISRLSWQNLLRKRLASLQREIGRSPRLVLLGVGNELNGDDAAGVQIVRRISRRFTPHSDLLFIDAGVAPENCLSTIARFHPDLVLWIDAADMGEKPGTIVLLNAADIEGISAFTHTLPPSVLLDYLEKETGCQIVMIGIQPVSIGFDEPISPNMRSAVRRAIDTLGGILKEAYKTASE